MLTSSREPPGAPPRGLLGALLDPLSVAVLVAGGRPRRVLYVNPRAVRLLGGDRYALLGLDLGALRGLLDARPCPTRAGERWKGTVDGVAGATHSVVLSVAHRRGLTVMELRPAK